MNYLYKLNFVSAKAIWSSWNDTLIREEKVEDAQSRPFRINYVDHVLFAHLPELNCII